MADWQRALLIPTSGIRSSAEAEVRASSALLAVLTRVRPLSKALLGPYGASRADRAQVEAFIETPFKVESDKTVRPDGLIRVTYGRHPVWVALVEVKTGTDVLKADQLNEYWDIARDHGYDAVISISNEIAPSPGVHPVDGLRVRANSRVAVHHMSWTMILAEAVKQKVHRGIEDPEQAWILGELIRYLEHPKSGAMEFDDMGPNWVEMRDAAHASRLRKRDPVTIELAQRWDQLMRFAALRLGSETGSDVDEVIPSQHQKDPESRTRDFVDSIVDNGLIEGGIRVPDAASDIHVAVDFRARRIRISADFAAPNDRGAKARVSWLTRQLSSSSGSLRIEAFAKNLRVPEAAELSAVLEDPPTLLVDSKRVPVRFRVVQASKMGTNRKSGRTPGFADSVMRSIARFYEDVLQNVTAFQRKAPALKQKETESEIQSLSVEEKSPVMPSSS